MSADVTFLSITHSCLEDILLPRAQYIVCESVAYIGQNIKCVHIHFDCRKSGIHNKDKQAAVILCTDRAWKLHAEVVIATNYSLGLEPISSCQLP